jgi:hypothetical protein
MLGGVESDFNSVILLAPWDPFFSVAVELWRW